MKSIKEQLLIARYFPKALYLEVRLREGAVEIKKKEGVLRATIYCELRVRYEEGKSSIEPISLGSYQLLRLETTYDPNNHHNTNDKLTYENKTDYFERKITKIERDSKTELIALKNYEGRPNDYAIKKIFSYQKIIQHLMIVVERVMKELSEDSEERATPEMTILADEKTRPVGPENNEERTGYDKERIGQATPYLQPL